MNKIAFPLTLFLIFPSLVNARSLKEVDRTGSVFVSPKIGLTIPVGALADANYTRFASSWRKEGITITGEVGYFITNTTVGGLEISYSTFNPKRVTAFPSETIDDSRVRIRRVGIFLQYYMIGEGKYRPFMKLGAGLFEASRISMPVVDSDPLEYKDYSLGAKPVMSIGAGVHAAFTSNISFVFSIEAVSLNSFSSSWETTGATLGPLRKNMLFFPVYGGLIFHLNED